MEEDAIGAHAIVVGVAGARGLRHDAGQVTVEPREVAVVLRISIKEDSVEGFSLALSDFTFQLQHHVLPATSAHLHTRPLHPSGGLHFLENLRREGNR